MTPITCTAKTSISTGFVHGVTDSKSQDELNFSAGPSESATRKSSGDQPLPFSLRHTYMYQNAPFPSSEILKQPLPTIEEVLESLLEGKEEMKVGTNCPEAGKRSSVWIGGNEEVYE